MCVAGKGNNGANAITCGRILAGRGFRDVRLLLSHPPAELTGILGEQLELFKSFGGSVVVLGSGGEPTAGAEPMPSSGLVIDGLLGTGITRPPAGAVADLIERVNSWGLPVLSCDIPSGLNHVTGEPYPPCVRATWTLNYHVVKSGQIAESARGHVGELWSAETDLSFTRFGAELGEKLRQMYKDSAVVRVF